MTATFATALTNIFSVMGESATFYSHTGSTSSVVVLYSQDLASNQPGGFNAQMPGPDRAIEYIKADIGRQVQHGEWFEIGGTDYHCQQVLEDDGYTVTVAVKS